MPNNGKTTILTDIVLLLGFAFGSLNFVNGAWSAPIVFTTSAATSGSAVLALETSEPVTMAIIPFQLSLKDKSGQPVAGARVTCELTMPSMPMPENRPQVTERSDGDYRGELIFTCAQGAWRMTCLAKKPDGSYQEVAFDIPKVRMR